MTQTIYKIVPKTLWDAAVDKGVFEGAEIDHIDGFIHFSTANQVVETAQKHFAGQQDLLLVAIDETIFGDHLKYEVSRGGDLFPHLYSSFKPSQAMWVKPLPMDENGQHIFPDLV